MGRIFAVELEGRFYRCKFCRTHLARADDLISTCELHNWGTRRKDDAFRITYCGRYFLLLLWSNNWMEICNPPLIASLDFIIWNACYRCNLLDCLCWNQCDTTSLNLLFLSQESAHEKSQKYKEGKFVLERARIVDVADFSTEFYIDSRACMSDGDDA
ncbi:hypothetical protein Fmac_018978 [Flemingia macrophylla]|uniref:Yippee domain-containing protein n=1 Tax=Flemingia macrophylla TaxID=520843 RepID=A0ABD1M6Y2_9FABA